MNQIKYILSAGLILLMIFMGIFLYTTFPQSGIVVINETPTSTNSPGSATITSKGEQVFKQNCAACHAMNKVIVGPALNGVGLRGPWAENKENLKKWIKNPNPFILNDPYAKQLIEKYKTPMPPQGQLSEADIDEVIRYITKS